MPRSTSLEFGTCTVALGNDWDTLERASRTHWRATSIPLRVQRIKLFARFPEVPYVLEGDQLQQEQDEVNRELTKLLRQKRQKKEAFIYIHGVNTSFEQAAIVMAQLWHFMGRQMIYSWPTHESTRISSGMPISTGTRQSART